MRGWRMGEGDWGEDRYNFDKEEEKVSLNSQLSDTFYLNKFKKVIFYNGSDYIINFGRCQQCQIAIFSENYKKYFLIIENKITKLLKLITCNKMEDVA